MFLLTLSPISVQLDTITVGSTSLVAFPPSAVALDKTNGAGGVFYDLGTTFAILNAALFHPLMSAISAQVTLPTAGSQEGLAPCWTLAGDYSGDIVGLDRYFPPLTFTFRGQMAVKYYAYSVSE